METATNAELQMFLLLFRIQTTGANPGHVSIPGLKSPSQYYQFVMKSNSICKKHNSTYVYLLKVRKRHQNLANMFAKYKAFAKNFSNFCNFRQKLGDINEKMNNIGIFSP
jgi:hypothetical protein